MENSIKFKRTIQEVGGKGTGSYSIGIPKEIAEISKIKKGKKVKIWYDSERKQIIVEV